MVVYFNKDYAVNKLFACFFHRETKAIQIKYVSDLEKLGDTFRYDNVSVEFLACKEEFIYG